MAYVEVQRQGFFSRLAQSIRGVAVGLLMFLLAFPLLYWNEGRAATHSQAYGEGRGQVVEADPNRVDAANEGKLVHLSGSAASTQKLEDRDFGMGVQGALRLRRTVEMYQWQEAQTSEKRKKLGGSEETTLTYSYQKVWSADLIDSRRFKESGYSNPFSMPYRSNERTASQVSLGAWQLTQDLTSQCDNWEKLAAEEHHDPFSATNPNNDHQLYDGGIFIGRNPKDPQIGDMRISYQAVRPCVVTVVSGQSSNTFRPFSSSQGVAINKLLVGQHSSMAMFDSLEHDNTVLTWIARVVGYLLMIFGLCAIFRPFVVMADVIPFFGDLLGLGVGLFSIALATPLALFTIAAGWITARPLVGCGLLALGALATFLVIKLKVSRARRY